MLVIVIALNFLFLFIAYKCGMQENTAIAIVAGSLVTAFIICLMDILGETIGLWTVVM